MLTNESEPAAPSTPKLGRPYTEIPEELRTLLDQSYADKRQYFIEVAPGQRRMTTEVVRLARIYCRRNGKSLHWQLDGNRLWLAASDKRPYTRRNT